MPGTSALPDSVALFGLQIGTFRLLFRCSPIARIVQPRKRVGENDELSRKHHLAAENLERHARSGLPEVRVDRGPYRNDLGHDFAQFRRRSFGGVLESIQHTVQNSGLEATGPRAGGMRRELHWAFPCPKNSKSPSPASAGWAPSMPCTSMNWRRKQEPVRSQRWWTSMWSTPGGLRPISAVPCRSSFPSKNS